MRTKNKIHHRDTETQLKNDEFNSFSLLAPLVKSLFDYFDGF